MNLENKGEGFITLYRSLKKKGYYLDSEYVHLWVHLLMTATFKEVEFLFNNKIHILKPGQLLTGRTALVHDTGINRNKIERILKTFENEQQIEQLKTNKYRVISICNWEQYQTKEQESEQQVSNKGATSEQQVSTYNNGNKENKVKKVKQDNIDDFIIPDYIPEDAWQAYMAIRKKKKSANTTYALNLIIEELEKINKEHGHDKLSVFKQSIKGSWIDMYPLKGGNNGNGRQGTFGSSRAPHEKTGGAKSDGKPYPIDFE